MPWLQAPAPHTLQNAKYEIHTKLSNEHTKFNFGRLIVVILYGFHTSPFCSVGFNNFIQFPQALYFLRVGRTRLKPSLKSCKVGASKTSSYL